MFDNFNKPDNNFNDNNHDGGGTGSGGCLNGKDWQAEDESEIEPGKFHNIYELKLNWNGDKSICLNWKYYVYTPELVCAGQVLVHYVSTENVS